MGDAVRARVSSFIKEAAPTETDTGSSTFWLLPTSSRQICGTISPTQPTCPHMETQEAVIRVAQNSTISRSARILTPELTASSSERGRRFMRQRRQSRTAQPMRMAGAPMAREAYPALSKLPISQ